MLCFRSHWYIDRHECPSDHKTVGNFWLCQVINHRQIANILGVLGFIDAQSMDGGIIFWRLAFWRKSTFRRFLLEIK